GGDWHGVNTADDSGWAVVTDPASAPPSTAIPCRMEVVPSVLRAQNERQGAETTLYTYRAAVPLRMRGLVKQGDHVVWNGTHYSVSQVADKSFATNLPLILQIVT
ncbi:MAG: hypothetical protein M3Y41_17650, partial [Pseudomonadota bacterium]|nr:hypothetical protein [Pseudomonadota bacterium]